MKHQAMTEEEISKSGLMQEGVYDFTIVEANEYVNDKGNEVMKLKLNVFDTDGSARVILDWVTPSYPKKFKHLHDACGLLDLYNARETKPENLIEKSGKLQIGIGDPYTDKNGEERINNTVLDYVKRDNMVPTKTAAETLEGDDVPF